MPFAAAGGGRARQRGGDAKGGSLAVKPTADSPGGSVAVVGDCTGLVGVALPALVAKRGDNRRNSELAITIVEALALALGVLAPLHRSCCVHCLTLQSVLGCPQRSYLAFDWGEIARQFVSYRDICGIAALFALISNIFGRLWYTLS